MKINMESWVVLIAYLGCSNLYLGSVFVLFVFLRLFVVVLFHFTFFDRKTVCRCVCAYLSVDVCSCNCTTVHFIKVIQTINACIFVFERLHTCMYKVWIIMHAGFLSLLTYHYFCCGINVIYVYVTSFSSDILVLKMSVYLLKLLFTLLE